MKIDPNAPAFPCLDSSAAGLSLREPGLTVRAEIAARIMAGCMAHHAREDDSTWNPLDMARYAVESADALIAELNKDGGAA